MVLAFLALTAVATALALSTRYGAIDPGFARRGIGTAIGAIFVVAGNFLPKMRPLNTPSNPATTTAAERIAGWLLVLVGIADIGLFMFARLDVARSISSIIGIGALAVIALNWAWLARGLMFGRHTPDAQATPQRAPTERRRIMAWLLFAIFYLAVTAWVKVFVSDPAATDRVGVWMLLTFSIVWALTGYRTSCRKQRTGGTGQSDPDNSNAI
jgi:dipeptide/tripeptide permease